MKAAMKVDNKRSSDFFDSFDLDSTVTNAKRDDAVSVVSLFNSFFRPKIDDGSKADVEENDE